MNNSHDQNKSVQGRAVVTLAALVILLLVGLYGRYGADIASWFAGRTVEPDKGLGAWGDSFGALNVVISTLAFVGILVTLRLQRRGMEEQAEDQHRQRFDASFFELLRLQREARRELIFFNTTAMQKARAARSYSTFSSATTGRIPKDGPLDPIAAADLEVHFQLIQMGKLATRSRDDIVRTYMRYVHSESEATIAPYFRIIYSILDRLRADPILTPSEKIRYANLIRGQLTSAEVLLLGINSLTPISADMQSLVTQFRMLKYLPNSSMRRLLTRFHEPQAFIGRDDAVPIRKPEAGAFLDARYRKMIAALHAERGFRRLTRSEMAGKLRKPEQFVADYEEGRLTLGIADLVDVAKALGSHPALFLRY